MRFVASDRRVVCDQTGWFCEMSATGTGLFAVFGQKIDFCPNQQFMILLFVPSFIAIVIIAFMKIHLLLVNISSALKNISSFRVHFVQFEFFNLFIPDESVNYVITCFSTFSGSTLAIDKFSLIKKERLQLSSRRLFLIWGLIANALFKVQMIGSALGVQSFAFCIGDSQPKHV